LEDVKNDLVLAHGAKVLDPQFLGHVIEIAHGHGLELAMLTGMEGAPLVSAGASALAPLADLASFLSCPGLASSKGSSTGAVGGSNSIVAVRGPRVGAAWRRHILWHFTIFYFRRLRFGGSFCFLWAYQEFLITHLILRWQACKQADSKCCHRCIGLARA